MGDLTPAHQSILATIGWSGIEPERLTRNGRDLEDLKRQELVVFWPTRESRPEAAYGGAVTPGRWYLTTEGAAAIGLDNHPLQFAEGQ